MYFKGSLFGVGEHIIADVPRVGWQEYGQRTWRRKKEGKGSGVVIVVVSQMHKN